MPRMEKGRPRLQRSASARGALQRSNSLIRLLKPWGSGHGQDDEYYRSSSEEEEVVVAPTISQEDAKVGFSFCRSCSYVPSTLAIQKRREL